MEPGQLCNGEAIKMPDSFWIVACGVSDHFFFYVTEEVANVLVGAMQESGNPLVVFETLSGSKAIIRADVISAMFSSTPHTRSAEDAIITTLNGDDDDEPVEPWRAT